jgi:3-oxoacyl-[acyl-carrier-protein] synthase II
MVAVAVTGVGVLTPLADAPDALFAALCDGRTALATSADFGGVGLAAIAEFEATKYANVRNLRMYNRTTRLAICAAKLALTDAKLDTATFPPEDLGLLMASTYGHLDVLIEYDRSLVASGMQRTNGALMPLAIPSAPGAMVALAFGAKAFSMTLSDGASSSLDAMGLAARWLAQGRARACLVVSAFSASPDVVRVISRSGALAATGDVRPFDRRATGTALGEAAVAFVLERVEDASSRGAPARGHVRGYGTTFAKSPGDRAHALRRATTDALASARVSAERIALVSAGASGVRELDRAEAEGLSSVLGEHARRVPVTSVKGALGETMDPSGAIQSWVAVAGLEKRRAPPILGLAEPDVAGLRYAKANEIVEPGVALVTALCRDGGCSAVVISGASEVGGAA